MKRLSQTWKHKKNVKTKVSNLSTSSKKLVFGQKALQNDTLKRVFPTEFKIPAREVPPNNEVTAQSRDNACPTLPNASLNVSFGFDFDAAALSEMDKLEQENVTSTTTMPTPYKHRATEKRSTSTSQVNIAKIFPKSSCTVKTSAFGVQKKSSNAVKTTPLSTETKTLNSRERISTPIEETEHILVSPTAELPAFSPVNLMTSGFFIDGGGNRDLEEMETKAARNQIKSTASVTEIKRKSEQSKDTPSSSFSTTDENSRSSSSTNSSVSVSEIEPTNSGDVLNLSSWGLPPSVLQRYHDVGITHMFQWQAECLRTGKVLRGGNLVYSAPTSAGKTMVAELLMLKRVLETKRKALFILPYVSVAREKMFYLQRLFQEASVRVEGFMGSHSPAGGFTVVDIAVCTIEKANSLLNRLLEENKVSTLGMVVVDEVHMLGDPHRGYLLELFLTKILFVSGQGNDEGGGNNEEKVPETAIQVICMSATLPNLDMLARWLSADLYFTNHRPVPLNEMVKVGPEIYDHTLKKLRDIEPADVVAQDDDHVIPLCKETISGGHSVLIFCPTKSWCEKQAEAIARHFYTIGYLGLSNNDRKSEKGFFKASNLVVFNVEAIKEVLEQLKRTPVGLDSVMKRIIPYSVAYHHAGLTVDERDIIEGAFRQGTIRVLVATSTLCSGVNLPARRVIIRTPNFHGKMVDPLVYKQMAGRAGRKGVDDRGESILVCKAMERHKATTLMKSELKAVQSCLLLKEKSGGLKRALLEVIVSGVVTGLRDVERYAACTFFASSSSENDVVGSKCAITETIRFLVENEFIRLQSLNEQKNQSEEGAKVAEDRYVPTQLGTATVASALSPDEALIVFAELQKARKCFVLESELHIIYQVTPIYVEAQWPNINWGQFLSIWERLPSHMRRVADIVGIQEVYLALASQGKIRMRTSQQQQQLRVHRRFFAALALQDLVHEVPLNVVASRYGATRGMVQSLQGSASTFAGMVTVFCQRLGWQNLDLLLSQFQSRLSFGVERELCDLVRISVLNAARARMLYNAGFQTIASLASAKVDDIETILRNAVPFVSGRKHLGETDLEVQHRREARVFWVAGKKGLSEKEAAELIVTEAKKYLQEDVAQLGISWKGPEVHGSSVGNGKTKSQSTQNEAGTSTRDSSATGKKRRNSSRQRASGSHRKSRKSPPSRKHQTTPFLTKGDPFPNNSNDKSLFVTQGSHNKKDAASKSALPEGTGQVDKRKSRISYIQKRFASGVGECSMEHTQAEVRLVGKASNSIEQDNKFTNNKEGIPRDLKNINCELGLNEVAKCLTVHTSVSNTRYNSTPRNTNTALNKAQLDNRNNRPNNLITDKDYSSTTNQNIENIIRDGKDFPVKENCENLDFSPRDKDVSNQCAGSLSEKMEEKTTNPEKQETDLPTPGKDNGRKNKTVHEKTEKRSEAMNIFHSLTSKTKVNFSASKPANLISEKFLTDHCDAFLDSQAKPFNNNKRRSPRKEKGDVSPKEKIPRREVKDADESLARQYLPQAKESSPNTTGSFTVQEESCSSALLFDNSEDLLELKASPVHVPTTSPELYSEPLGEDIDKPGSDERSKRDEIFESQALGFSVSDSYLAQCEGFTQINSRSTTGVTEQWNTKPAPVEFVGVSNDFLRNHCSSVKETESCIMIGETQHHSPIMPQSDFDGPSISDDILVNHCGNGTEVESRVMKRDMKDCSPIMSQSDFDGPSISDDILVNHCGNGNEVESRVMKRDMKDCSPIVPQSDFDGPSISDDILVNHCDSAKEIESRIMTRGTKHYSPIIKQTEYDGTSMSSDDFMANHCGSNTREFASRVVVEDTEQCSLGPVPFNNLNDEVMAKQWDAIDHQDDSLNTVAQVVSKTRSRDVLIYQNKNANRDNSAEEVTNKNREFTKCENVIADFDYYHRCQSTGRFNPSESIRRSPVSTILLTSKPNEERSEEESADNFGSFSLNLSLSESIGDESEPVVTRGSMEEEEQKVFSSVAREGTSARLQGDKLDRDENAKKKIPVRSSGNSIDSIGISSKCLDDKKSGKEDQFTSIRPIEKDLFKRTRCETRNLSHKTPNRGQGGDLQHKNLVVETPESDVLSQGKHSNGTTYSTPNFPSEDSQGNYSNQASESSPDSPCVDSQVSPSCTFTSVSIIDVSANELLFHTFMKEWKTRKEFSFAVSCERVLDNVPKIGGRFSKGPKTNEGSARELAIEGSDEVVVGIAVCWSGKDAYYVSLKEYGDINDEKNPDESVVDPSLSVETRVQGIKSVLEYKGKRKGTKYCFDAISQYKVLAESCGITLSGEVQDPKRAAWLLDPSSREKTLHQLTGEFASDKAALLEGIGAGFGTGSLGMTSESPTSGRARSCTEAVVVYWLMKQLRLDMEKDGLDKAFYQIEMPVVRCLARMELNGIGFSNTECDRLKSILQAKQRTLEEEAYRLANHSFSLTSPDEVAMVLFIELKLPPDGKVEGFPAKRRTLGSTRRASIKCGKRGRRLLKHQSTNKDILERLKPLHPLPGIIMEWRRINCALTKVVYPVQRENKLNSRLGMSRIYPTSQTHTATGRVSFAEPNLQNVPRDFDINIPTIIAESPPQAAQNINRGFQTANQNSNILGPSFSMSMRTAFVPFKGGILLAADYSQLELRLIAHLSKDERLLKLLNTGGDVFRMIAGSLNGIEPAAVSDVQRQSAKQICYGIIYGIGPKSLGEQLELSEEDASIYIEKFKSRFNGIRKYLKASVEFCRNNGYVITVGNRRRYLPAISSTNAHARSQAERQAVNTTVQGSAADLVKTAMINIDRKLNEMYPSCRRTHRHKNNHNETEMPCRRKSTRISAQSPWTGFSAQSMQGARVVLQLHDELILEVAEGDLNRVAAIVKKEMENAIKLSVVLPVKLKAGPSWGTMNPLEL